MAENLSYTHKKEYVEVDHRGQARGDTEVAIGHGLGMVVSGQESALEVREVLNYFG